MVLDFISSTVVLSKSNKGIPNDTCLDIQIPPQKVFQVFFGGSKYQTSAGGPGCLGHACYRRLFASIVFVDVR